LQPSTVTLIIRELLADRWVRIGARDNTPLGRKPTSLHLNGGRAAFLGIDLRPTETKIAIANLNMRFVAQETMLTSGRFEEFMGDLCERVCGLIKSHPRLPFVGIGLALPGRVELPSEKLVFAPNLGWSAVDLKAPLEKATGLPVELDNAANALALAEIWSGNQSEHVQNLLVVTISEGIGVGMVLNGKLFRGNFGLAGEFGHVRIMDDGPLCNCGNRGCLEACASNTAAVRYFNDLVLRSGSKHLASLNFPSILRLARIGETFACEALDRMARFLGLGIAMLVTGLAPDVVVLVGDLTSAWDRIGPIINETVQNHCATKSPTQIVPTDPRTQPRLRAAIVLALQKYLSTEKST